MKRTPIEVTDTAVVWRWKAGLHVPPLEAPNVVFRILYREVRTRVKRLWLDVALRKGKWQRGNVTGLQPDTQYEFEWRVYWKKGGEILYMKRKEKDQTDKDALTVQTSGTMNGLVITPAR